MTDQIVAHTEAHETIDCPHCGAAICAHYPADWDTGEACETTHYATGVSHDCQGNGCIQNTANVNVGRMG